MGSTAPTTYSDALEGKLLTAVTTSTTTGITYKVKQVNGVTPTHPTTAHRLHVTQRTATTLKHEVWGVAAGTTQDGQTVTLGTVTRGLPLDDGTDFSASGTPQSFSAGADVFMSADAHDLAMSAKLDLANTFTTHQTISSTNELRFADSATAVWDDGTDLNFKSSAQATRTLTQLASASGSNDKFKISSNDTTEGYAVNKITAGAGITATETDDAGNETLAIAAVNTVATGHTGLATITSGGLIVGAGTSNMTVIGPGTTGQVPLSNGTTIAMGNPVPTGALFPWTTRTAPTAYLLCNGTAVSRSTYSTLFSTISPTLGTVTITIASPGVFTLASHGLLRGDAVYLTTTDTLPTGLTANTIYYVIATGLTSDEFQLSATVDGAAINTSVSQAGTHTLVSCPYGLGDGSTTFNIPDLRGRYALGDDKMGTSAASRLTLTNPALGLTGGTNNGSHTHTPTTEIATNSGGATTFVRSFTSTSVVPPYVTLFYIIKT